MVAITLADAGHVWIRMLDQYRTNRCQLRLSDEQNESKLKSFVNFDPTILTTMGYVGPTND